MRENPYLSPPETDVDESYYQNAVRPTYLTLLAAPASALVGAFMGLQALRTSGDSSLAIVVSTSCTWLTVTAAVLWQEHRHQQLTPLYLRGIAAEMAKGFLRAAPFAFGVAAFGAWASYFPLATADGQPSIGAAAATGFFSNLLLSAAAIWAWQRWRRRRRFLT